MQNANYATFLSSWFHYSRKGCLDIKRPLTVFLGLFAYKERIEKFLTRNHELTPLQKCKVCHLLKFLFSLF